MSPINGVPYPAAAVKAAVAKDTSLTTLEISSTTEQLANMQDSLVQLDDHLKKWDTSFSECVEQGQYLNPDELNDLCTEGRAIANNIAQTAELIPHATVSSSVNLGQAKQSSSNNDLLADISRLFQKISDATIATLVSGQKAYQSMVELTTEKVRLMGKCQNQVFALQALNNQLSNTISKYEAQFTSGKIAKAITLGGMFDKNVLEKIGKEKTKFEDANKERAKDNGTGTVSDKNKPEDDPQFVLYNIFIKNSNATVDKDGNCTFPDPMTWHFPINKVTEDAIVELNNANPNAKIELAKLDKNNKPQPTEIILDETTIPSILSEFTSYINANSGLGETVAKDQLVNVNNIGKLAITIMKEGVSSTSVSTLADFLNHSLGELQTQQTANTQTLTQAKSAWDQTQQLFEQNFRKFLAALDWNQ